MRHRRVLRVVVGALVAWYLAFVAFGIAFPYCNGGGLEGTEAACYFGAENYGWMYHNIEMLSFIAAPIALCCVAVWAAVELVQRARNRDAV